MNPSESQTRFDELNAGQVLNDLSPEEIVEWTSLSALPGNSPDPDLEWLATAAEVAAVQSDSANAIPTALLGKLQNWADQTAPPAPSNVLRPDVPKWWGIIVHPLTGWAAAAAIIFFLLFSTFDRNSSPSDKDVAALRDKAPDLIERNFAGLGPYGNANGSVIWSDVLQSGYMLLNGVPSNDPQTAQYQLWIVDPSRDPDAPVDGGVFNIPTDGSPAIIPIDAKLAIKQPQVFVITLEQPGGVVKSKQETVVAIAKL
jgi:hypothetical protein